MKSTDLVFGEIFWSNAYYLAIISVLFTTTVIDNNKNIFFAGNRWIYFESERTKLQASFGHRPEGCHSTHADSNKGKKKCISSSSFYFPHS